VYILCQCAVRAVHEDNSAATVLLQPQHHARDEVMVVRVDSDLLLAVVRTQRQPTGIELRVYESTAREKLGLATVCRLPARYSTPPSAVRAGPKGEPDSSRSTQRGLGSPAGADACPSSACDQRTCVRSETKVIRMVIRMEKVIFTLVCP
jgi:hypothetical protein